MLLKRNDSIACYEGDIAKQKLIAECTFNNLRKVIQQKQREVAAILGNRNETVVIIIPDKESSYGSFVKVLDEIQINDIKHYFVMDDK